MRIMLRTWAGRLHRPEGGLVQDPDLLRSLVAVQGLCAAEALLKEEYLAHARDAQADFLLWN